MHTEPDEEEHGEHKAWLWMIACCVPMIAVIILIALGYWGSR